MKEKMIFKSLAPLTLIICFCLSGCGPIRNNAKDLKHSSNNLLVFSKSAVHADKRRFPRDNKKFITISEDNLSKDNLPPLPGTEKKTGRSNFFNRLFAKKKDDKPVNKTKPSQNYPNIKAVPPLSIQAQDKKQIIAESNSEIASINNDADLNNDNLEVMPQPLIAFKPQPKAKSKNLSIMEKIKAPFKKSTPVKLPINKHDHIKATPPIAVKHRVIKESEPQVIVAQPLPDNENLEINIAPNYN